MAKNGYFQTSKYWKNHMNYGNVYVNVNFKLSHHKNWHFRRNYKIIHSILHLHFDLTPVTTIHTSSIYVYTYLQQHRLIAQSNSVDFFWSPGRSVNLCKSGTKKFININNIYYVHNCQLPVCNYYLLPYTNCLNSPIKL